MYDIGIIGAGVAGSYLAYLLKKNNIKDKKIIVFEKSPKIKLKDSGIVSTAIEKFFDKKTIKKLIDKKIRTAEIVSPSRKIIKIKTKKPFVYVLKRKKFAKFLRSKIKIKYETVEEVKIYDNFSLVKTDKDKYFIKVLVGADGANSITRKAITNKKPKMYFGIFTKSLKNKGKKIFLNKLYSPDFIAWSIFGEYGLVTGFSPKKNYSYFLAEQNVKPKKLYAGLIPTGLIKTRRNNCILIGDAACQVKPITGGGIIYSLTAAAIAHKVILSCFASGDFSGLKNYEREWHKKLKKEIRAGLLVRKVYRQMSNNEIDDFFDEFGPDIEQAAPVIENNYDNLSKLIWKMPKLKLIKFILKHWRKII